MARKETAWIKHVKSTRASNPSLGFKAVLKAASKTWKK